MKRTDDFNCIVYQTAIYDQVAELAGKDIDGLKEQIWIYEQKQTVTRLRALGLIASCSRGGRSENDPEQFFPYITVGLPSNISVDLRAKTIDLLKNADFPRHVWATKTECERLFDMAQNLPLGDAFARWTLHVEEFEEEKYTKTDADRDTRNARQELRKSYERGEIDTGMYRDLYRTTDFSDLAN